MAQPSTALLPLPFPGAQSPSIMAKGNNQKTANGSTLQFEAPLWTAAEQAVPAPDELNQTLAA
jgi:hypothetical protein